MREKDWDFEKGELIARLSRAEGQIRSIKNRFEGPHDPAAVLQQLSAARNAIEQVGKMAILEYLKSDLAAKGDPVKKLEAYSQLVKKYGW